MLRQPDVYEFNDGTEWLRTWFAWWRGQARARTLGVLARKVGCSKSTLSLTFAGKRHPSREAVLKYNAALALDLDQVEFLCLLFDRDRARTHEDRTTFVSALERRRREHTVRARGEVGSGYVGAWEHLVVREAARCMPIPEDVSRLLSMFPEYLRLEAGRLEAAVGWLRAEGLLVPDGGGMLRADRSAVETPPSVDDAREIHVRALEQAARAIGEVPHQERELGILTIGIRRADVPMVKAEIWRHLERLRDLADASTPPDVVYQLTLQMVPMLLLGGVG